MSEGHKAHQDKFTFVTKESNGLVRTMALYKVDDWKDICGMKDTLVWKVNRTGQYSPLLITVSDWQQIASR